MIFAVQDISFNQGDIDLGHQTWQEGGRGSLLLASHFLRSVMKVWLLGLKVEVICVKDNAVGRNSSRLNLTGTNENREKMDA